MSCSKQDLSLPVLSTRDQQGEPERSPRLPTTAIQGCRAVASVQKFPGRARQSLERSGSARRLVDDDTGLGSSCRPRRIRPPECAGAATLQPSCACSFLRFASPMRIPGSAPAQSALRAWRQPEVSELRGRMLAGAGPGNWRGRALGRMFSTSLDSTLKVVACSRSSRFFVDKPFLSSAIKSLADRQPCEAEQCLPSGPNTTTLKKGLALWTTWQLVRKLSTSLSLDGESSCVIGRRSMSREGRMPSPSFLDARVAQAQQVAGGRDARGGFASCQRASGATQALLDDLDQFAEFVERLWPCPGVSVCGTEPGAARYGRRP